MQRILAIAWLTWKAALRFKLFLVIAVLLILAVVGLPLVIRDDGTAQGFTQIIITYTLSAITALLGLSTLWLSCGTLARDIEECQIQVVVTKPIARWQIWLGKWLGIVTLKAAVEQVPPGSFSRPWQIDLGFAKNSLADKPLQLRIKFNGADRTPSGTFTLMLQAGDPKSGKAWRSEPMSLAPSTESDQVFHEIPIPANLFDSSGVL